MKAPVGVGGLRGFGGAARLPLFMAVVRWGGAPLRGLVAPPRMFLSSGRGGRFGWPGDPRIALTGGPLPNLGGLFLPADRGGGMFLPAALLLLRLRFELLLSWLSLDLCDVPGRGVLKFENDFSLDIAAAFNFSGGVIGLARPMSAEEYLGGNMSIEDLLTSDVDIETSFSNFDIGTNSRVEECPELLLFPRLICFSGLLAMTNSGSRFTCR